MGYINYHTSIATSSRPMNANVTKKTIKQCARIELSSSMSTKGRRNT
jgi:hypothetical protein